ncbi:hypothetical protein [Lentzea sp. NPDC004782]|uniref:hypothetical protein n=1 Tax=Lentzea sp. NPDC004782 TaxID=3154458 RepID=UPI0033BD9958
MREIHRAQVQVADAKSLIWAGGELVDVSAGWRPIPLDGSTAPSRFGPYGPQFDAATISPLGDVAVLMATAGTKALVLGPDGTVRREINRSYYHAEAYRYPLTLCTMEDGRTGLVHCPSGYNRLDVEDALTGQLLTTGESPEQADIFHSRLMVPASGRYLLSAGWVWHPWDVVVVYDLQEALTDRSVLDSWRGSFDLTDLSSTEVSGACFAGDDLVVSTSSEDEDEELMRLSLADGGFRWRRQLDRTAGDLLPIAGDILSVHEFPRLYSGEDGELLAEWPDLATGRSGTSIVWDKTFSGPARVAVDEAGRRFAVTDGERVTVIHLG